jgi:hypothetical protein
MDNLEIIRTSLEKVFTLREIAQAQPELGQAVAGVKRIQASRFQTCYSDLMESPDFGGASRFFLEELYGEADYSQRDAQFARIAGTLVTVFPSSVVGTAVALAQLHALTEELDYLMALECVRLGKGYVVFDVQSYVMAWRAVGRRVDRQHQLDVVLNIGRQLIALTRKPGLAVLLKLMRGPASHAGLASLQHFLESGFSIFGSMARSKGKATEFLNTIEHREEAWIAAMFDIPQSECIGFFR